MPPSARRHDPQRRDRIVEACLRVIAERGVAGTSQRQVAVAADVPLGSMTYHFTDREELLREAFGRFADRMATRLEARMSEASTLEEALEAFAATIDEDVFTSRDELILAQELYTLAAREPSFREITTAWMTRSRETLHRFVDPQTAAILDALNEGLALHRALHTAPSDSAPAREAITRLAGRR